MTDNPPSSSRIAIKFGGLAAPKKFTQEPSKPPALGKRARKFNADSDEEGEDGNEGRHEAISGFGEHGAELESSRRSKLPSRTVTRRPSRTQQQEKRIPAASDEDAREGEQAPIQWGLTLTKPGSGKHSGEDGNDKGEREVSATTKSKKEAEGETIEDEALESLLGKHSNTGSRKKFVIKPTALGNGAETPESEVSTLKEYDEVPVEGFGVALLRGLGWDGKDRGPKIREPKRREAHLALGAKKLKEAEDLGAWGHTKKRARLEDAPKEDVRESSGREEREGSERDRREGGRDRGYDHERNGQRESNRYGDRDYGRDRHRDRDSGRGRDRVHQRRDWDSDNRSSRHDPRLRR